MTTKRLNLATTGLLIGLLCTLSACQSDENSANKATGSNEQTHDHSQHAHGNLEVTRFGENTAIPSVSFTIKPDSMSGWNIHITTQHFRFAPENVNADAAPGEGHAHLYVDNYKMARIYGNWYHLKKLTPGEHEVRINLNANDHSNWSHHGQAITATQTVNQQ